MQIPTEEQARRTAIWNTLRDNVSSTNPYTEFKMLEEEQQELQLAIYNKDLVEILDGIADIIFVAIGTETKANLLPVGHLETYKSHKKRKKALLTLAIDYLGNANCAINTLNEQLEFKDTSMDTPNLMLAVYELVITANEQKPKEKINGKIIKGENFIPPNKAIGELLKSVLTENTLAKFKPIGNNK